jgi:hypothetical protein
VQQHLFYTGHGSGDIYVYPNTTQIHVTVFDKAINNFKYGFPSYTCWQRLAEQNIIMDFPIQLYLANN